MTYRPIPSRPGYFAGDDGSIWSFLGGKARKRKLTKCRVAKNDYRYYVSFRIGGKPIPLLVSRLVAEAFHGPCPGGMECCHENGDALDNRAENLRWGTHQANMDDRDRHGTTANRVGAEGARRIMALKGRGRSDAEIASELGLPAGTVWSVTSGRTFSRVTGLPKRIDRSRRKSR